MSTHMTKTWFVDGQITEQVIPEAEIYKREWVGLTEEDVFALMEANTKWMPAAGVWRLNEVEFARVIEAKLKEKNT